MQLNSDTFENFAKKKICFAIFDDLGNFKQTITGISKCATISCTFKCKTTTCCTFKCKTTTCTAKVQARSLLIYIYSFAKMQIENEAASA